MDSEQNQSYGEKLVGLSFNPSGEDNVTKIKKAAAAFTDVLNDIRNENYAPDTFEAELLNDAMKQTLVAQMLAVKATTWQK